MYGLKCSDLFNRCVVLEVNPNAVRRVRKQMQGMVRAGRYQLRVVGSQSEGFRLGAERGETVILFGPHFEKQGAAVEYGLKKKLGPAKKLVGASMLPAVKSRKKSA